MLRPVIITTAALLALVSTTPSGAREAGDSPTTQDLAVCLSTGGEDPQPHGSNIAACCITDDLGGIDEKGCWICNWDWSDCVWDPAYRTGLRDQVLPDIRNLTIQPGRSGGVRPQLPRVRVPGTLQPVQ